MIATFRPRALVLGALATLAPAALLAQQPKAAAPAKAAIPATAATPAAALPAAPELVARYVKAIGGREAVLAHKSVHSVGSLEVPAMGLKATAESWAMAPDRIVVKITMPGMGETMQGYDGTVGWSIDPNMGPRVVTGRELAQIQARAEYGAELHDAALYRTMETLERTEFEGRPAYKVRFVRTNGDETIEFFDAETALILGGEITAESPMGTVTMTLVRQDYKPFGGVLTPTKVVQRVNGQEMVVSVDALEFDGVDAKAFELPAEIRALVPAK